MVVELHGSVNMIQAERSNYVRSRWRMNGFNVFGVKDYRPLM